LEAHQALENELAQLRQAKRSAKAAQQVSWKLNNSHYDTLLPNFSYY
jgi:hypothetical protein